MPRRAEPADAPISARRESSRFPATPVVAGAWSRQTVESGESATTALDLPPGTWELSLQYDATRPVSLSAGSDSATVPGNLDYRGTAPYWAVPELELGRPGSRRRSPRRSRIRRSPAGCSAPTRSPTSARSRPPGSGRPEDSCAGYVDWYRALMDLSFGEALLIFGSLLAVVAALSGLMRGTVLSASVLSIALGIVLAELDLVSVDVGDEGVVELIELALILTLVSDGLLVDRELLGRHWGPPARALVVAMPITLILLALGAKLLFGDLTWAESFLLGAVLCATDPVVTSAVVTSKHVPSSIRHTLNLESGLNDGLALPFVLFFLVLASPGGDAGPGGRPADRRGGLRRRARRRAGPLRRLASPRRTRRGHRALRGHLRDRLRVRRLRARGRDLRQRADRRLRLRDHPRPRPSPRSPSASPTSPRTSARSSRC